MGLLQRGAELGLGALLLTRETAEELVRDLLGEDREESEPGPVDRLRTRAESLRAEFAQTINDDLDRALAAAGLIRRAEFDRLAARVAALEAQLSLRRVTGAGVPYESTSEF